MSLTFEDVTFRYGGERVLDGVTVSAAAGQVTCLLGRSGTGKTTLLRLAAGMLKVQSGNIHLDGALLASAQQSPPPEARPVGLVFQEGALFPHMTVGQNVGYGLARSERAAIVPQLLERVGLSDFAERYPHTLSGGQQQRVALIRALAPSPRVLLLDEPFASIDMVLRRSLRTMARGLLNARDCITLLVTHDPEEAMEMADLIVVLDGGQIAQAGPPAALYDQPKTLTIAQMIGGGSVVEGTVSDGHVKTNVGSWPLETFGPAQRQEGTVMVLIRETGAQLTAHEPNQNAGTIVTDIQTLGPALRVRLDTPSGETVFVQVPRDHAPAIGSTVSVRVRPGAAHLFFRP